LFPIFFLVAFLLVVPFGVLFFGFDPLAPTETLRFGEGATFAVMGFFLLVPPGVVT